MRSVHPKTPDLKAPDLNHKIKYPRVVCVAIWFYKANTHDFKAWILVRDLSQVRLVETSLVSQPKANARCLCFLNFPSTVDGDGWRSARPFSDNLPPYEPDNDGIFVSSGYTCGTAVDCRPNPYDEVRPDTTGPKLTSGTVPIERRTLDI